MDKEKIYITNSSKETQELGIKIAKNLKKATVLAFFGNLGSGKTTFIQGFAKGLGIKKRIISPTFIIVRSHKLRTKNHELSIMNFYHIDLYRTASANDLLGLGVDELISNDNIVAIEWAEKMNNMLPKKRIELYFEYVNENTREIKIKKYE